MGLGARFFYTAVYVLQLGVRIHALAIKQIFSWPVYCSVLGRDSHFAFLLLKASVFKIPTSILKLYFYLVVGPKFDNVDFR